MQNKGLMGWFSIVAIAVLRRSSGLVAEGVEVLVIILEITQAYRWCGRTGKLNPLTGACRPYPQI